MAVAATGETTIEALPVAIFHRAVARSSWSSGCGDRFWNGSTSRAGSATSDSGSQAAVSSQKPCSTGTKSSTARLSVTTTIKGRSAMRRKSTSSKAFAVEDRPETRMRPVPSRRWEATRVKAGSISTSAKSSRTKGRSMHSDFNRSGRGLSRGQGQELLTAEIAEKGCRRAAPGRSGKWARISRIRYERSWRSESKSPPSREEREKGGAPGGRGVRRSAVVLSLPRSSAQQGAGQTGGAAAAVDADFAGGESADVKSGVAEAVVGVVILFDGEQAVPTQRQNI